MKNTLINGAECHKAGQQGYERKLMSKPNEITNDSLEIDNSLLLARPKNPNSVLTYINTSGEVAQVIESKGTPLMIASRDHMMVALADSWSVELFPLSQITTLISFLDYQMNLGTKVSSKVTGNDDGSLVLSCDGCIILRLEQNSKKLMDILINGVLEPQKQSLQHIFSFVRNIESYWVAYFLLSQVFNEDKESDNHKLYNACKVYGVSESYFRKLCHNAFTRGPKKQLRMWRAAHSALQLIEKDKSISTIAGNNGYSSSSHFSSEIKSLFGITPREFKKLEGLLNE
ncbi:helix-turn-helix domain-containing protein [Salmonella enterica]